jgi:predicted hydrocarbon binding protein
VMHYVVVDTVKYLSGLIINNFGVNAMFKEERSHSTFSWDDLGDIEVGRPNLGQSVPVLVYRLFQYTMRDILITDFDVKTASKLFVKAGKLAGEHFCRNVLNADLEFNEFIAELQQILKDLKIGVLRVEKADLSNLDMTLTVAEDLDCSGLPILEETVCDYDEGFIAGILKAYTGKDFLVKEVDCWATGDRVCRFAVKILQTDQECVTKKEESCLTSAKGSLIS